MRATLELRPYQKLKKRVAHVSAKPALKQLTYEKITLSS
jgi:hypothetical protein